PQVHGRGRSGSGVRRGRRPRAGRVDQRHRRRDRRGGAGPRPRPGIRRVVALAPVARRRGRSRVWRRRRREPRRDRGQGRRAHDSRAGRRAPRRVLWLPHRRPDLQPAVALIVTHPARRLYLSSMADLAGFSRAASGHLALAALALGGAPGGSGGGGAGRGGAPGPDGGGPPGVELAADEGAIRLPVGGSAVVAVTAERTGGFEGDLVLEVSGLPGGVTAEPVSLPAGASEASLTLEATDAAEQGGPLALSIQVRSPEDDSVAAELERALYVAGPPGSLDASFGEGGIASLPLVDGQVL